MTKRFSGALVCSLLLSMSGAGVAQANHTEGSFRSGIKLVHPGLVDYGEPFEIKFDLRNAVHGVYDYGSMWCRGARLVHADTGVPFAAPSTFEHTGAFHFVSWEVIAVPEPGYTGDHGQPFCELENEAPHPHSDPWWGIDFPIFYESEPTPEHFTLSNAAATPRAVKFDLSHRAKVRVRVKDTEGQVVKRGSFYRNRGSRAWWWNKDSSFEPGKYRFRVIAIDENGNRAAARASARVMKQ